MRRKLVHFLLLTALVAASALALADPPARVGRISSAEGQVTVQSDGEEASGGLLNWPLTSDSRIITAPGARTEFRIGSTAVRLDGDSNLEVTELDDDSLRLRLNYGSASVRVRSPEMLAGFELSTPQARVVLTEAGVVRVDTERAPDTSLVTVLAGAALVEGAGTSLTVRAGRRAEVRGEDIGTGAAQRDRFDEWAQARDQRDDNVTALRYVPPEVTGYEELDRYGTWRESEEYGPLWAPRSVASDWAPYRDGRWTWLQPWGWTWVDNAPWGYAPSHYGRWVMVSQRWYWAPGRHVGRPVWAPALVGWVGGNQWNVTFGNRRSAPGVGWFPLTPRDHYVPSYRVSPDHERRLGWRGGKWDGRDHDRRDRNDRNQRDGRDGRDGRRDGVTVLPRDRFDSRQTFHVNRSQRGSVAPGDIKNMPLSTAPQPANAVTPGRVIDSRRGDRGDREEWRERQQRGDRGNAIGTRAPAAQPQAQPPALAPQPAPSAKPQPVAPAIPQRDQQQEQRANWRAGRESSISDNGGERRARRIETEPRETREPRFHQQRPMAQPVVQQPAQPAFVPPPAPVRAAPPPQAQPQPQLQAQPQPQPQPQPQAQPNRGHRENREIRSNNPEGRGPRDQQRANRAVE